MDDESTRVGRPVSYRLPLPQSDGSSKHARATSTVAQSFAADLDSVFGLGMGSSGGLETLSQTVEEKKANVSSGQSELEKLEAKLRETEQRLAKVSRQNSPSRPVDSGAETPPTTDSAKKQAHPLAQRPTYPDSRPTTGARPQTGEQDVQSNGSNMPGAMPESSEQWSGNGREDYVMVDNGGEG